LKASLLVGLVFVAGLAACGGTSEKSDWERQNDVKLSRAEEAVALPAWPRERDLIEFFVSAASDFRFFVDSGSVSVGKDGVVRYTLVARSSAGAQNVSYEGMRCESGEVRTYALGHDGAWGGKPGEWRAIQPRSVQRWHNALYREYFCPQREPLPSRELAILALRRGGPSITNSLTEDTPRGGSGSGW
jgi:hypothetical protein